MSNIFLKHITSKIQSCFITFLRLKLIAISKQFHNKFKQLKSCVNGGKVNNDIN